MEAPKKIYLNGRHPEPYWFKDRQLDSDIEYISKDALIEWANNGLTFRRNGVILDDGFSYTMVELIKKLESM